MVNKEEYVPRVVLLVVVPVDSRNLDVFGIKILNLGNMLTGY